MRGRIPKKRRGNEGVALILALLFIVLLSVLVVEFTYEAQVEASFTMNQEGDYGAYLAAKSGVARGLGLLAEDLLESTGGGDQPVQGAQPAGVMGTQPMQGGQARPQGAQQLGQPAQGDGAFAGFLMDSYMDPVPWHHGIPFEPLNEAIMRTSISDEYGKINLNALLISDGQGGLRERTWLIEALINFFNYRDPNASTPPADLVDAILDWMDYGDDLASRPGGAEADYYRSLDIPYAPKNGPMDSIEELLLIKGMTPELYFGDPEQDQMPLSEYLTVHGDWDGRININTAPLEVLQSVFEVNGGDPGLAAEAYEAVRVEQPYTSIDQVQGLLPEPEEAQPRRGQRQQGQQAQQVQRRQQSMASRVFTVSSNVFRVRGDGMQDDTLVRVEAYVFRAGGAGPGSRATAENPPPDEPFRILAWNVIR